MEDVSRARRQLAVARAVLDELERALPAGTMGVSAQLADELTRLGQALLEAARSPEPRTLTAPRGPRALRMGAPVGEAPRRRLAGGAR